MEIEVIINTQTRFQLNRINPSGGVYDDKEIVITDADRFQLNRINPSGGEDRKQLAPKGEATFPTKPH